jgi:F420-non-reducing hydrogenase iron-sulfur subunit
VEPAFVLQALAAGADGVLIAGCHPGGCHWGTGNLDALRRHHLVLALLDDFGIERERVRLAWIGASEGRLFARTVLDLTRRIRALGPLARAGVDA